jgi:hypothetical protein
MLDLGNSGSGSAAERYVRIRWHNDRRVLDDVSMRSNILKSCAKGTEVKNDAASILLHAASKMWTTNTSTNTNYELYRCTHARPSQLLPGPLNENRILF